MSVFYGLQCISFLYHSETTPFNLILKRKVYWYVLKLVVYPFELSFFVFGIVLTTGISETHIPECILLPERFQITDRHDQTKCALRQTSWGPSAASSHELELSKVHLIHIHRGLRRGLWPYLYVFNIQMLLCHIPAVRGLILILKMKNWVKGYWDYKIHSRKQEACKPSKTKLLYKYWNLGYGLSKCRLCIIEVLTS